MNSLASCSEIVVKKLVLNRILRSDIPPGDISVKGAIKQLPLCLLSKDNAKKTQEHNFIALQFIWCVPLPIMYLPKMLTPTTSGTSDK